MKPIRIDSERLVFSAVLKRGVPTVPKEMQNEAKRLASLVDCKIKDFGGNFTEVWFYFDRDLTEEEAEEIENER